MQVSDEIETVPIQKLEAIVDSSTAIENVLGQDTDTETGEAKNVQNESEINISETRIESSLPVNGGESVEGLYIHDNVFSLIPKSAGALPKLKTLKFFRNVFDMFPVELGSLSGLENLQVNIPSPDFNNGFSLNKLKGLKELELTKGRSRSSVFTILCAIAGLKSLIKLSVCNFSIRYIPPQIGCLESLEYLDLSFNKLKKLPEEISCLISLICLKVANNKLVSLPSGLSSLQKLENLDLSSNRLTSLDKLDLWSMQKLQTLNLQYNKLQSDCKIPPWMFCDLQGNCEGTSNDDINGTSVEMDVNDASVEETNGNVFKGPHRTSLGISPWTFSNSRCFSTRKSSKRWKRQQQYFQHRARQERLNNSRKGKGEGLIEGLAMEADAVVKPPKEDIPPRESPKTESSSIVGLSDDHDKYILPVEAESEDSVISVDEKVGSENCHYPDPDSIDREGDIECCEHDASSSIVGLSDDHDKYILPVEAESEDSVITVDEKVGSENCPYPDPDSIDREGETECCEHDASLSSLRDGANTLENGSFLEKSKSTQKSKRHSDRDLDNPKPCKHWKPTDNSTTVSYKYSSTSFCSSEDRLPDGFYDAGRDRPFMPISSYQQTLHLDSREVILVDRDKDEELDAISFTAQTMVYQLKQLNGSLKEGEQFVDTLKIASFLSLFVSDHFGGGDRSALVERTRKAASGSNYRSPFICTCSTGNMDSVNNIQNQDSNATEDINLTDLCEKSLRSVKSRRNSVVVPLGALKFGVCRHRSLLMKYLCDRMEPPVPCELVRGYLDFFPHAWNIVRIKRGDIWVRMVVDPCRPHDIREESDPEYFCRYIPLNRVNALRTDRGFRDPGCSSFPFYSTCDEIATSGSSYLVQCKFGSLDAAAKVRTLDVCDASVEQIRNFEYNCIGEVRMLGVLKHSCIIELYGHQISSKWVPSAEGDPERRVLQSAILMEHVKGGSLKSHIEKLLKAGKKHLPVKLALYIAKDIASALVELHSKHIIHRDIKSENILIDLDEKRSDGTPVVKLCDFDQAVPLRSLLHTCCIGHKGIPPPNVCVGTPRWMAPEVLRAMYKRSAYGLEVDIWSYGCLIFELLTLQVPYCGLSEASIHECIEMGKRAQLTDELEALISLDEDATAQFGDGINISESDVKTLKFLVDVYRRCTTDHPTDRPTAIEVYELLLSHIKSRILPIC